VYEEENIMQPTTTQTPTTKKTMRAMSYSEYGRPSDVLALTDLPVPSPADDQVLIEVRASSINALDWRLITGTPLFMRLTQGLSRPKRTIPGADVSGSVVAIGASVSDLRVGDEVIAQVRGGGFAEFVLANEKFVVAKPASLNHEEASTLGVAPLTALQGLRDWGRLQPGQSVLINGASGGVGTFAVQIARALGASRITAVASTKHIERIAELGADLIIDYTLEDFTEVAGTHDLLFDNAGMNTAAEVRRVLAENGTHVMVTGPMNLFFGPMRRMLWSAIRYRGDDRTFVGGKTAQPNSTDLSTLVGLVEQGEVTPVMDRHWKLEEAVAALEYQGEGHARGKSVVVVS
jgi:NADPH:quinone reductase-like Zn-dependent oxidoreductase